MTPQARVYYEFSKLNALEQWWQYALMIFAVLAVCGYVYLMYRRDWVELPRGLGWALLLLRIAAFAGLLLFFLDLQKRSEQAVVKASRVAVLVDGSLSMTLPAGDAANETGQVGSPLVALDPQFPLESRLQQVQRAFAQSELLAKLSDQHEVTVYQFGKEQRLAPIASFSKKGAIDVGADSGPSDVAWTWRRISILVWSGTALLIVGALSLATAMILRLRTGYVRRTPLGNRRSLMSEHNPDAISYTALSGVVMTIMGLIMVGTSAVRAPEYRFANLWSFTQPAKVDARTLATGSADVDLQKNDEAVDWLTKLTAQGSETRLGDAIAAAINTNQNAPLAGIVVFSDGQNNAGLSLESAGGQAMAENIPVYVVGLGSSLDPVNARIVDMNAPRRVFPGDPFRIGATVQASGLNGKSIPIQLRRRSGNSQDASSSSSFNIEQELVVQIPKDGQMASVDFDVTPPEIGTYTYDVKLLPPSQDTNKQDDAAESDVEVIEPRATVLVFAGGPTREYQFVRNLLFRDETIQSHVFLQTGSPGMSQEADQLLTEFPSNAQDMAKYDCVLSFDADFMALDKNCIDVLEDWVASGAGGLVVVAGPVATPNWAGTNGNTDPRAAMLRDMSPVVMNAKGSRLISLGRFESDTEWPLKLAGDAISFDFLDIANSPADSIKAWQDFPGVYNFYNTYEAKPGATSLASFSDPTAIVDDKLPIYLAAQFYGGGRVVFQGSGELWRIREIDENLFNTYWTKLVRWSAQGRLLRDSDYGMLIVDKEDAILGEQISVRAVLKDQQFRPLTQPTVTANLADPIGHVTALTLNALPGTGQMGVYVGQFLLRQPGKYLVKLDTRIVPDAVLSKQVVSRVPTLEIQRPKRNDSDLVMLSQRTNGLYYAGLSNAIAGDVYPSPPQPADRSRSLGSFEVDDSASRSILSCIPTRDQISYLPGAPDRAFQERWMLVLMVAIAGVLSLEWLLRRLSRLA